MGKQSPRQQRRQTEWAAWNYAGQGNQWPQKSYKDALVKHPPGLSPRSLRKPKNGNQKNVLTELGNMAQKHWQHLPDEVKGFLTGHGLGEAPQPKEPDLKEILLQHLGQLPVDVKAKVEGLLQPQEVKTEQTAAQQLKQTVGHLRDLTNRRQQVQVKVDSFKEQYKAALTEFQDLQAEIDKAQQALKQSTDKYAQLIAEVKLEADNESKETLVGMDAMFELMNKAGLQYTPDQKELIGKLLEENQHKKRRVDGAGAGLCG